jgi:polyisoprenoid-binding protein YceI
MRIAHPVARALSAAALAATLCGTAAAATLAGDPAHSAAQFSVKHLAISTVSGAIPVVS